VHTNLFFGTRFKTSTDSNTVLGRFKLFGANLWSVHFDGLVWVLVTFWNHEITSFLCAFGLSTSFIAIEVKCSISVFSSKILIGSHSAPLWSSQRSFTSKECICLFWVTMVVSDFRARPLVSYFGYINRGTMSSPPWHSSRVSTSCYLELYIWNFICLLWTKALRHLASFEAFLRCLTLRWPLWFPRPHLWKPFNWIA
jgi:hypothetical protein